MTDKVLGALVLLFEEVEGVEGFNRNWGADRLRDRHAGSRPAAAHR